MARRRSRNSGWCATVVWVSGSPLDRRPWTSRRWHSGSRARRRLIDDCDHRLREHLRALPAPAENVQTLAEILSEDLATWPENAWLVLDDYHEVTPEPKAEDFIEALVALSPVQLLIASRVRPRWVASKGVLYGDVLEVTQSALAMSASEAAAVLVDRSAPSATGLVALAQRLAGGDWSCERVVRRDRPETRPGAGVALPILRG